MSAAIMTINASNVKARLDSILNTNYGNGAPGCALLVAKNGKVIYCGYRGVADMDKKSAIDKNTSFNIASISKQFTVIGILKCQELGLLNIDDYVSKYISEFKGDIWKKVKLSYLMSHSSGVPDKRPRTDKNFMLYSKDDDCLGYMHELNELKFEPGTNYDYINPTFQILREIIQRVSGMDFDSFQEKYLFKPAGMSRTTYFEPNKIIPNIAHGYIPKIASKRKNQDSDSQKTIEVANKYYQDSSGKEWSEYDYGEETFFATKADGGIYTNIFDFLKWENALLNSKCLNKGLLKKAYNPHTKVSGSKFCQYQNRPNTYYGYGWFIDSTPNKPLKIYHTGDNGGFQAYASKYPSCGVNVIMLENRNDIDRWTTQLKIEQILLEEGILH